MFLSLKYTIKDGDKLADLQLPARTKNSFRQMRKSS